jgi:hypothetical protein
MSSGDQGDSGLRGLRSFIRSWWRRVGLPIIEENWRFALLVVVGVLAAWVVGAYYGW